MMINDIINVLCEVKTWCSEKKARYLCELIFEIKPNITVEIGVYGGGSFLVMALAHQEINHGLVYGVDPWCANEAKQNIDTIDNFIQTIDFEELYSNLNDKIKQKKLEEHCCLYRTTSIRATEWFHDESVDLLHIDGNHSTEKVILDIQHWLPKLSKDAIIIFDDINWKTVKDAVDLFPQLERQSHKSIEDTWAIYTINRNK